MCYAIIQGKQNEDGGECRRHVCAMLYVVRVSAAGRRQRTGVRRSARVIIHSTGE